MTARALVITPGALAELQRSPDYSASMTLAELLDRLLAGTPLRPRRAS